jgi:alanyl-tRNA synthetase
MGEDSMTIDFDRELDWPQLMEIETLANKAVRDNLPVLTSFPKPEELKTLEYRSKLDLTENVRIVEIPGVDRCACCAPHVSHTGEIGVIKVLEAERHRGGVRLSLVCGMQALSDYRMKQDNVTAISQALSVKRRDTAAAVERLLSDQQGQKERIGALSMALVERMAESYEPSSGNICVFDNMLDEVAFRELVNRLMEKCGGIVAAFSGSDREGYKYIMGSLHIDLRAKSKELNSLINGRGGGKPRMIQGSAMSTENEIREQLEKLQN